MLLPAPRKTGSFPDILRADPLLGVVRFSTMLAMMMASEIDLFDGSKRLYISKNDASCLSVQYAVEAPAPPRRPSVVEIPGPHDIVFGRGRWYAKHIGNRRLQSAIHRHLERYQGAPFRKTKTSITHEILDQIKNCPNNPGRFLRYDKKLGGWVSVDDDKARLKISQAMRYIIRNPACDEHQSQQFHESSSRDSNKNSKGRSKAQNSPSRQRTLTRPLCSLSSCKSDPDLMDSSEQNMPPPPRRESVPSSRLREVNEVDPGSFGSDEESVDEVLLTDEEIYIALGYGPNPFHEPVR